MLILETTEQPAAAARNLRRIEREVLVLGEGEAHRRERGQPGGAAELLAAAPDTAEAGRFVARADLPEIDPGVQRRREVPHQLPEVHPLLGGEIHRELLAVPLPLGVADFHVELPCPDLLQHRPPGVFFAPAQVVRGAHVLLRGAPQDRLLRNFDFPHSAAAAAAGALLRGGFSHGRDPAEVESAIHRHDDRFLEAKRLRVVRPEEIVLPVALESNFDGGGHQASV